MHAIKIVAYATLIGLTGLAQAQTISNTALPTGGVVAAGSAAINQSANSLTVVQRTARAIVNWDSFNVGKDSTVNFIQPDSNSSTLKMMT